MNTNPQFRLAVESDADLLLNFMQDYYAYDGHAFDREKALAALVTLLRDPKLGAAWLILDGDVAVGYIVLCFGYSLEWLGRDAFVDEFYLREAYRGRGWGQAAMAFLEDAARERGVRALHLEVIDGNQIAARLYQKIGFSERKSKLHSKWIAKDLAKPVLRNPV